MQEPLEFPVHPRRNRFRESGIGTFLFPESVFPGKDSICGVLRSLTLVSEIETSDFNCSVERTKAAVEKNQQIAEV